MIAGRNKRKDREREEARADTIAAAAREATLQATLDAQKIVESNERAAAMTRETAQHIEDKIQVVHTLVNSEKTAGMQRELDGKRSELALLTELTALRSDPSSAALERIAVINAKIAELEADLAERDRQQRIADDLVGRITDQRREDL
jgi:hypothetical protein